MSINFECIHCGYILQKGTENYHKCPEKPEKQMTSKDFISVNSNTEKKPPAIWIPIILAITAYIFGLLHHFNWEVERAIFIITRAPGVAIEAIGTIFPLVIGLIHLGISQFFKSKRNSYSRRYIIIYWSIASFVLLLLASFGRG
jgi:hypothetical protein